MQVVGNARLRSENFNGVSEKLRKELIPDIKPGEVIHFQLLNGSYDATLKRDTFGSSRSIRLRDRIYDPYAVNEKGEISPAYVEIGVHDTITNGRVERCKKHWVESIATGIPGNGQFEFIGGNVSDMEIVSFLCLSNDSEDNPYRDKSKEAKYKRQDFGSMQKQQKDKDFKELQARLKLFSKQNPEEASKLSEFIPTKKEPTPA